MQRIKGTAPMLGAGAQSCWNSEEAGSSPLIGGPAIPIRWSKPVAFFLSVILPTGLDMHSFMESVQNCGVTKISAFCSRVQMEGTWKRETLRSFINFWAHAWALTLWIWSQTQTNRFWVLMMDLQQPSYQADSDSHMGQIRGTLQRFANWINIGCNTHVIRISEEKVFEEMMAENDWNLTKDIKSTDSGNSGNSSW